MAKATIQDLETAAKALITSIDTFDAKDQQATIDQSAAETAASVAHVSAGARDESKQAFLDANTAFQETLAAFLSPAPPVVPNP